MVTMMAVATSLTGVRHEQQQGHVAVATAAAAAAAAAAGGGGGAVPLLALRRSAAEVDVGVEGLGFEAGVHHE